MNLSVKTSLLLLLTVTTILPLSAQDTKTFIPIAKLDKQYQILGELGKVLGTGVTVKGKVVDGPTKGHKSGLNLLVQFIDSTATQHKIQIPLTPRFGKFGDNYNPNPEIGATYQMKVFETGGYLGIPTELMRSKDGYVPQSGGYYFVNELVVLSAENTDPVQWSPDQFIGKYALFTGIAKNDIGTAVIENAHWKLQLTGCQKWTDFQLNKAAEVYGKILTTNKKGIYKVLNGQPRLVNLADQVGKTVKLRGTAWSMNGDWWFNYQGTGLYVKDMQKLPSWKVDNHGETIEITGTLQQEILPSIHHHKDAPTLQFIIYNASWKPLKELLTPELDFND